MENVKLPGYRGNGLEGIFKEAVAREPRESRQMLGFLPSGFVYYTFLKIVTEFSNVTMHTIVDNVKVMVLDMFVFHCILLYTFSYTIVLLFLCYFVLYSPLHSALLDT